MANPNRDRSMPSTPRVEETPPAPGQPVPEPIGSQPIDPGQPTGPTQPTSPAQPTGPAQPAGSGHPTSPEPTRPTDRPRDEPAYLIEGTGCVAGHERGRERDAGPLGQLPSARTTWIGVGLLVWCSAGLYFLVSPLWIDLAVLALLLWLAFSAFVQRRAGHRGRCWRTRTWRHAWGGLVPYRD